MLNNKGRNIILQIIINIALFLAYSKHEKVNILIKHNTGTVQCLYIKYKTIFALSISIKNKYKNAICGMHRHYHTHKQDYYVLRTGPLLSAFCLKPRNYAYPKGWGHPYMSIT